MIAIVGISVGLVCFILYALDRRAKGEPIDWTSAGKLTLFGGIISSGVMFATSVDTSAVVETVKDISIPEVTQEMFVGKPTF